MGVLGFVADENHAQTVVAEADSCAMMMDRSALAKIRSQDIDLLHALHKHVLKLAVDRSNELMLFNAGTMDAVGEGAFN